MGACDFSKFIQTDKPVNQAFQEVRDQALYEHGHGGYSGTIAEKNAVIIRCQGVMTLDEASKFVNTDIESNNKWGPAFALSINDPKRGKGWLFYGLASS